MEPQNSTTFYTGHLPAVGDVLKRLETAGVLVPDPAEVSSYLVRYPDVMPAMIKAVEEARNRLPEAHLVLSLYHDAEFDHAYLVLYVRLRHYTDELLRQIEEIDDCYLPMLAGTKGWFVVTTDFLDLCQG